MASFTLNNVTAPDAYTPGTPTPTQPVVATLDLLPILDHVNIDVVNAAIYWSIKQVSSSDPVLGGSWQPEVFQLPGSRTIRRLGIVGIRFRAAIPAAQIPAGGFQAQVTIEAVQS